MPSDIPTLYEHLIDYAGVFPPAALPVDDALAEYRSAVAGPHGSMLGPMLLTAPQWSALDDDDVAAVADTAGVVGKGPVPEAVTPRQVEVAVDLDDLDPALVADLAGDAEVLYVESSDPARAVRLVSRVAEVRKAGTGSVDLRAKIRTGGATPGDFPTVSTLASFLLTAAMERVPVKATAGLHGPFRHESHVVEGATEHGFVNVLAAARAAVAGEDEAVALSLAETDPATFDPVAGSWKDVGAWVPADDVRGLFCSFGSCSFDEPVEHLQSLGVLTAPGDDADIETDVDDKEQM